MSKPMLQLEKYFFPKIFLEANPKFKPLGKGPQAELDVKNGVTLLSKEERIWRVTLDLKALSKEDFAAYKIDISVVGFFKVDKKFPESEMEELVKVGGSSILYSATRDFVLTITARGPWPAVFLPTTSFMKPRIKSTDKKQEIPDETGKE